MSEVFTFGRNNRRSRKESDDKAKRNVFQIFFSSFWKLVSLNMLYFVCILPIITFGPATAAFMKILRNISQERPSFIYSDFFAAFKSNFKQSFFVGIFDVAAIVAYISAFPIILASGSAITLGIFAFSLVFFSMVHFYLYLILVSINLPFKDIVLNSIILAIAELKKNAITLLFALAVIIPSYLFFPMSMLFLPLLPLAFLGFVICYNSYPIIRKHIIQPYYDQRGELNPEFEYLQMTGNELSSYKRSENESEDLSEKAETVQ